MINITKFSFLSFSHFFNITKILDETRTFHSQRLVFFHLHNLTVNLIANLFVVLLYRFF